MNFAFIRKNLPRLNWLRPHDRRHALGRRGERAAARHLKRRRFRIIARNYRCPAGEVDLICTDRETIVFVEVKTRTSDDFQDPQDTVSVAQRRRLFQAARFFLMEAAAPHRPARFDVVTVIWAEHGAAHIEHFQDAYRPERSR